MSEVTARHSIDNWIESLKALFKRIEVVAEAGHWVTTWSETAVREDPVGLGTTVQYDAPILILTQSHSVAGGLTDRKITFEPKHRYTIGAAGRIDVYSYPALREAMLLRIATVEDPASLTQEQAEELVSKAPWKGFSQDRIPLSVDFSQPSSIQQFLSDLAD